MEIQQYGHDFILSSSKCLFWPKYQFLIIADAHFAKENHFRKNGIPIPHGILQFDLHRIDLLIKQFHPKEIIFLGDMFHSEENEGHNEFLVWRKKHTSLTITLILGNHDILIADWYTFAGITCISEYVQIENIILSHDKLKILPESTINFYGHIHPAIRLSGKAKQALRLPCFWFGEDYAVLPAFGRFTGAKTILPLEGDRVYGVGEDEVFTLC